MPAFGALACAGLFWALGFPFGKVALAEISPEELVFLRFLVASIAAAPFALRHRDARALFRNPMVVVSGVLYGLAFIVQYEGLARTSVALAALLVGMAPALIAVSARMRGEQVRPTAWLGVVAACIGAALIVGRPGPASSGLGIALMLLSLLVFVGWQVSLKKIPSSTQPLAIPSAIVIVATITVLVVVLATTGSPLAHMRLSGWLSVLGQGILSTFAATAAWQFGATRVGSASAGVFVNVEPLLGAALGIWLFGDRLTSSTLAGGALILVGSMIAVLSELPKRTRGPAVPATPA